MKNGNLLFVLPLAVLTLAGCTTKKEADASQTLFTYTLSWENKNQAYEHFTDLGHYAVLLEDAQAADAEAALALFSDRDIFRGGCTATVKRNQKGEVIFGRNMDIDVSQTPVFLTCIKGGKHQALVFTYNGPNCYRYDQLEQLDQDAKFLQEIPYKGTDAMNEAGLFIETNMREMDGQHCFYCSGTNPGKTRATFLAVPALVATNCATVEEALTFLADSYDWYTPGFVLEGDSCIWNMGFLIGDATGNYGLIELAHNRIYYTPYCPGHANFYVHPELAEYAVNGCGYGRLAAAMKGLPQCETEQEMMDNMKACMYMNEILHPGCYGYDDYLVNVDARRETPVEAMQQGFEAQQAPFLAAAQAYVNGEEEDLRNAGNVWTTSLNFGVNCKTRHLLLRLWEKDDVVMDIQWK